MNERIFNPGKRELQKLYKTQSAYQIARHFGVNPETVRKRLHEHGIKVRRVGGVRKVVLTKRQLDSLYQKHSIREIARMLGVGQTVIHKRLAEFGIQLRDPVMAASQRKKGIVFSEEHRRKLSEAHKGRWAGKNNPNWKGGVNLEYIRIRRSPEYREWKQAALERAEYRCESCGSEQGAICECCGNKIRLHVHHVKPFSKFPEARFDPANSEVLCPKCHYAKHEWKTG